MRKFLCFALAMMTALSFSACDKGSDVKNESETESHSSEVSVEDKEEIMKTPTATIRTLDYTNTGRMGDRDGPAFAVYSKIGYSGASVKMNIADMEIQNVLSDGRFINGYAFLGVDVHDENGEWINCVDAGLCWSGVDGGWHVFYNMFEPLNSDTPTWYESPRILPKDDIYTMTLELSSDNHCVLNVVGEKGARDRVRLEVKGAKKDGHNTAFLYNVALDYPPNTKVDRNGNPSEDWVEITLANTDKNMYLKSFRSYDLTLFKGEEEFAWTNDRNSAVSIWPDKAIKGFDYSPTEVILYDGTEYYINLDMNR